jgi:hypothetical protein
VAVFAEPL